MAKTSTKKKGAAEQAAPAEKVEQEVVAPATASAPSPDVEAAPAVDAPAAAEQAAAETDDAVASPATDANVDAPADESADAVNTAAVVEALAEVDPEAAAEVAAVGVDTAATLEGADEPVFPIRVRVTNHTRMPVQTAAVPISLGPAPSHAVVVISGQREYDSLTSDLESLRVLNGFGDDAFVIEALTEDDE